MSDPLRLLGILILLGIANSTPIVAKNLLGDRFAAPLDGRSVFSDGRPLFGASKTIRGVILAIACTALAAALLGLGWGTGAIVAAGAMLGDLASSFTKRRLGLKPHAQAFLLDQIPEAVLPLLLLRVRLDLGALDIALLVAAFVVLELILSRLLFRLHLRDRPY